MDSTHLIGLILLTALQQYGVAALQLRVQIPPYKMKGEMAELDCHWELEGDESLYSVKWYKENEEFYRYVPKSNPPQQSYKVDGIKVDHHLSNSRKVTLRGLNGRSSGVYRCEANAEAPSFASAQSEGRLQVVFLPNNGPFITGDQWQYQIGDELNLNCTSGKSSPASVLHWFINDQQVTDPSSLEAYPHQTHPHGFATTVLGLVQRIQPGHFEGGSMRVKCVASLSPVLWQGDKESVVQRFTPHIKNREALLLVKSDGKSLVGSFVLVFASFFSFIAT